MASTQAESAYGVRFPGSKLRNKNHIRPQEDAIPKTREHQELNTKARVDYHQLNEVNRELVNVKKELSRLRLDLASVSEAKANAEKEAEASGLSSMHLLQSVEELRKQIDESDEEHVLVELARIEAEREHQEIEIQRVVEVAEFAKRMQATSNIIKNLNEEMSQCEELQMELGITNLAINVLQAELDSARAKERDNKNKLEENNAKKRGASSWHKSALEAATAELLAAKLELASIKEEGFQFMNSMDRIREEIIHIAQQSNELQKLEKRAESSVAELNSQLVQAKTKLEATKMADEKTRAIASNLLDAIRQLETETEAAQKETETISAESGSVKTQTERTELEISSAEDRLRDAAQVLLAARASEAVALKRLKDAAMRSAKSRASMIRFSSSISITRREYNYLMKRAEAAETVANKKVEAAKAWIETLMDREKKALVKAELIEKGIRESRDVEVRELYETQRSVFARKSLEEEIKKIMKQSLEDEEEINEQAEEENYENGVSSSRVLDDKPRKSIRGEGMLPRTRSVKLRRIPSSPATRYARSPSVVMKKRRKAMMPNLVKFLKDRKENLAIPASIS